MRTYCIDPFDVQFPDDPTKAALNTLFTTEQSSVRSGMMSIVYIVGKILSRLVKGDGLADGSDVADVSLKVNIKSYGLPIGAGLGSSASFSVAAVASCLRLQALLYPNQFVKNQAVVASGSVPGAEVTPDSDVLGVVNGWAFASEILLHGSPSGLDNTTSCYGGLVKFSRKGGEKFENITGVPALHILLVNTRVPRSTKLLVAGVRALHDAYPDTVGLMLESMNSIALKFLGMVDE